MESSGPQCTDSTAVQARAADWPHWPPPRRESGAMQTAAGIGSLPRIAVETRGAIQPQALAPDMHAAIHSQICA